MENVKNLNTSGASIEELNATIFYLDADNMERLKRWQRPLNREGYPVMLVPKSDGDFDPQVIEKENQPELTAQEYSEFVRRSYCPFKLD